MFIDLIVGTRPNFIKIAGIIKEIKLFNQNSFKKEKINFRLIHTGQHYSSSLSDSFFNELNIDKPHINLKVKSGSQSTQTSKIMIRYEEILKRKKPSLCLVVGDVNSTMACAITAKKMNIKVAHVEAGLRSNDNSMPEEINRIVTDSITDYFFTTSRYANDNLIKLGFNKKNIHFVGNTMIDTLKSSIQSIVEPQFYKKLDLERKKYFLMTLHRPSNVDDKKKLSALLKNLSKLVYPSKIIFPAHLRTLKMIDRKLVIPINLKIMKPSSYLKFIFLLKNSMAVITDSGGVTEEATVLKVPCLTLRTTTERPETVAQGSNILIGNDFQKLKKYINKIKNKKWKKSFIPHKWDGNASRRIIKKIIKLEIQ